MKRTASVQRFRSQVLESTEFVIIAQYIVVYCLRYYNT